MKSRDNPGRIAGFLYLLLGFAVVRLEYIPDALLAGRSAAEAHSLAIVGVSRMVAQQADFLASLDGFYFLMGVALVGGIFACWQKQID